MDRQEFQKINRDIEPFLVDGKMTLQTEIDWLESMGIIIKTNTADRFAIRESKTKEFKEYSDKISNLYWWRSKIKNEIKI